MITEDGRLSEVIDSMEQKRLVILSGPSCVGKSPLSKSLAKFYPDLSGALRPLVLYNSRAPRPGEVDGVDYHFRTREQIESFMTDERFAVLEVRGDLQSLDLERFAELINQGSVFFEGNPFVGRTLLTHPRLAQVAKLSVFMAPLSREEIIFLRAPERNVSLPALITDVMRRKLLRRGRRQKSELSLADLENIEKRAASAYGELREARHFDYVIPNHDGEDSENWDAFYYPLGDARKALLAFASLLEGRMADGVEHWDPDLLP
jgi:guanylate kinase